MTTRLRILISSLAIPLLFILISIISIDNKVFLQYKQLIIPSLLAFLEMFLVAWIVNFNLKGERYFTVLVFPAISIAILIAFLDLIVSTTGTQVDRLSTVIGSAIILFVINYIITSAINILNLASYKKVPLGQAARAAHYVLTMIFSYFSFALIVSFDIHILVRLFITFFLVFTYSFVALWTISLAYSQRMISSFAIAFLMIFASLILSLWPIESFYFALFLTFIFYMCLGMALEIREILGKWIWWEYLMIFFVIFIILLSTASWGVNGTIL